MRLSEVEKIARNKGIASTWMYAKKELIKQIQKAEGNSECFGTAGKNCVQMACCWREDCLH